MHSIIVFASGKGSNAAAIIEYFKKTGYAKVALIVSNKADAGVLDIAKAEQIPFLIIDRITFSDTLIIEQIQDYNPSLIVLAGFLWKMPDHFVKTFSNNIINIHPALLPLYGGKGMYGRHVHNAVLDAKETESGITVHYVNEVYDSGNIILQARCEIKEGDTADVLARRIRTLEHYYYPRAIEFLLRQIKRK